MKFKRKFSKENYLKVLASIVQRRKLKFSTDYTTMQSVKWINRSKIRKKI